jgi:hypothetical protein
MNKQKLIDNIKNIAGYRTKRKIVVISVDDYGNIRLASREARKNLDAAGVVKANGRFDKLDALEDRQDLESLYSALCSVKDWNGNHAIFTPFAIPCNINFDAMIENDFSKYVYEPLNETYDKLSQTDSKSYGGTWELWKEGIEMGIMVPQFHGREHFNLKVFLEKLKAKDHDLLVNLKNKSYASMSNSGYSTINITAAFEFWNLSENEDFKYIISSGLDSFERVFGYKSTHFNAPGGCENPIIHQTLSEKGILYLDTPWIKKEHRGNGNYKRIINFTGKKNHLGQTYLVRNVIFEPNLNPNFDCIAHALNQIEAAFFWNKPANISTHRVNFSGHIDPQNRNFGVEKLKQLLAAIVKRWPEVEFMSANKLGELIALN